MIPPFLKQIPIFNNIWNFSLLFYSTKQHLLKLLENSIHNKLVIIEDFHPFKADLKAKSDIFISVLQTTFHQDWAKFRNNDFLIITHPFPNNKTELLSHLPRFLFEIPHVIVPPILNLYFNSQDIDVKTVRQTLGVEYGKFLFSVAGGGNFGNFLIKVFQWCHNSIRVNSKPFSWSVPTQHFMISLD